MVEDSELGQVFTGTFERTGILTLLCPVFATCKVVPH